MTPTLAPPDYLPIAEHGVVGDLRTVALVATDGSVDWLCVPRFDSPSVFGAILDRDKGGHFRIAPASADYQVKQLYLPDTNVLITRFLTPTGVCEVEDFMPVSSRAHTEAQSLVRRVLCVRGSIPLAMVCKPRFDYGRVEHETSLQDHGAVFPHACALSRSRHRHATRADGRWGTGTLHARGGRDEHVCARGDGR